MCLHNCFKVEAHAIPQSELAAGGASKQSSALWCPFYDVDRMLDLIEGRVYGFGGNGLGGICDAAYGWLHVDNVACTGALDFGHGGIFVSWAAVAHPLYRGRAIVGDSSYRSAMLAGFVYECNVGGRTLWTRARCSIEVRAMIFSLHGCAVLSDTAMKELTWKTREQCAQNRANLGTFTSQ